MNMYIRGVREDREEWNEIEDDPPSWKSQWMIMLKKYLYTE
jgi:hypothetical protein